MTIGAGAAVVPMPGGAGVVTPNVTVMIVIFTLNVILCFCSLILRHCLAIIYHLTSLSSGISYLDNSDLPPEAPKDCDSDLHNGNRHLEEREKY